MLFADVTFLHLVIANLIIRWFCLSALWTARPVILLIGPLPAVDVTDRVSLLVGVTWILVFRNKYRLQASVKQWQNIMIRLVVFLHFMAKCFFFTIILASAQEISQVRAVTCVRNRAYTIGPKSSNFCITRMYVCSKCRFENIPRTLSLNSHWFSVESELYSSLVKSVCAWWTF